MRATIFNGLGDISVETVRDPELHSPGDAIVSVLVAGVCGTDLWQYRGLTPKPAGTPIGHEFVGLVREIGSDVASVAVGDLVIVPFTVSDGSCTFCTEGLSSSCLNRAFFGVDSDGGQGEHVRVPFADGTLVRVAGADEHPDAALLPALLALTDVFTTGHHAAVSAGVTAGSTVAVIGDGAVGLSAVLAASRLGAERIIALSSHPDRQQQARANGASEVIGLRGDEAVAAVRDLTDGLGASAVLECVGTGQSLATAVGAVRDGGGIGYVGIPHGGVLDLASLFRRNVRVAGGMAPVRGYIEQVLPEVLGGWTAPGAVFTDRYGLEDVVSAYRDLDSRAAVKPLLDVAALR